MADRAHSTSRRALLAGLATSTVLTLPAAATAPSDLASLYESAVEHDRWINSGVAHAQGWDDDRLDDELDKYDAVFKRGLVTPSASLKELAAKARLCLHDFERQLFPFRAPEENPVPDDCERMVMIVLREIIALGMTA